MKWVLIVTIYAASGGFGGPSISTQRVAEFETREQCEAAGRQYVNVNNGWSTRASYICAEALSRR